MMTLPPALHITEVGPRDGLQNESAHVAVEDKTRFVDLLTESGLAEIEVSSFVSPKWVPQLGDAADLFERITRRPGVVYSALVPNEQGLERAMESRVDKIAVFTAASETFSQRNTAGTIAQTLERFAPVVRAASAASLPVRAYISCAVACPYEGPTPASRVREVADRLLDLGVNEIDLGDTIGVAVPTDIEELYDELEGLLEPAETVLHLHDTRGTALACVVRAIDLGVTRFDASVTGLGGCPYAPGASGNLATEELVYLAEGMACRTGVDMERLLAAGRQMAGVLGRTPSSRLFRAEVVRDAE